MSAGLKKGTGIVPNPLRRGIFRLGERDRLGRRGRRPADRLLLVLYESYRGIQAQRERWAGIWE